MKLVALSAMSLMSFSGAGLVVAQLPSVPDNWASWPATAILGFITLTSFVLLFYVIKQVFQRMGDATETLTGVKDEMSAGNQAIRELCGKIKRCQDSKG